MRSGERIVRGTARGLDESGGLMLEMANGALLTVVSGEVQEVRAVGA